MFGSFNNMLLEVLASSIGGSEFGANIRLGGHSRIIFFGIFPSEIRQMAGNKA
jgi:hypothetical protein